MKNKLYSKLLVILIFLMILLLNNSYFAEIGGPYDTGNGSPPGDGILETDGDWIIETSENITYNDTVIICNGNLMIASNGILNLINVTLEMNGNLIINGNGVLNLNNVTLKMNCNIDGQYRIHVKSYGSLYINDNDNNNLTLNDASIIRNGASHNHFYFWIDNNANFIMKNSELHECGYGWGGTNYNQSGLHIETNNVIISGNLISNNYYGIHFSNVENSSIRNNSIAQNTVFGIILENYSKNNDLSFNHIKNSQDGIFTGFNSNNNIIHNNSIYNNFDIGIRLRINAFNNTIKDNYIFSQGRDAIWIYDYSENNTINDNEIYSNSLTSQPTRASISIDNSDYNIIMNNNIYSNTYTGIVLTNSDKNKIINNFINNNPDKGICLIESNYNNITNNGLFNNIYGILSKDNSIENPIYNNSISMNDYGIHFDLNSKSEIHFNWIYNNNNYGVINQDASILINATYNWWGSHYGPFHAITNPSGLGDKVSDYVEYYPWLSTKEGNIYPTINTEDNLTAIEDKFYKVQYNVIDLNQDPIKWNYTSNATWLNWGETNHTLWGTPANIDVGTYWICINITDGRNGYDEHNFTLTVINVNDHPLINTTNIEIAYEDALYEVDYNATDVDSLIADQVWTLATNASSWLNIKAPTGILSGIPTNDDVGEYWVNVSVGDGDDGSGFTNFTLIVVNVNDPPEITTYDVLFTNESELYQVDYNATDVDSPQTQQTWTIVTNATWLSIDPSTGVLSGTPVFKDLFTDPGIIVAWWHVNVNVSDGDSGSDRHEFILFVFKDQELLNEPPLITTTDVVSTTVDELYYVDYDAIDDWTPKDQLTWKLTTDAGWLTFSSDTGVLTGTPGQSNLGVYWVNVSVLDTDGGVGFHNFTLTVYSEANEPPDIQTEDDINAVVGELYSVDYESEDDHTPLDKLQWSLETNASDWLDIDPVTGMLSGTPELINVGSYWVKVSVFDGEDGWDFTNFTLWVTTEPITSFEPELNNPSVTPTSGNTETLFIFSVEYSHPEGDPPDSIQVVIDEIAYDLKYNTSTNSYEYNTTLSEGAHTYYFTTTLSEYTKQTEEMPIIVKRAPDIQPEDGDGDGEEDNTMLYAGIGIVVVIIIVVLILLFIFLKKKPAEEAPEAAPPVAPQPTVTPPAAQPPAPGVQPTQPPPAPTEAVTQPQMPQMVQPPVPPQPVIQPTVTPQIMPTVTEAPMVEEQATDEELEE